MIQRMFAKCDSNPLQVYAQTRGQRPVSVDAEHGSALRPPQSRPLPEPCPQVSPEGPLIFVNAVLRMNIEGISWYIISFMILDDKWYMIYDVCITPTCSNALAFGRPKRTNSPRLQSLSSHLLVAFAKKMFPTKVGSSFVANHMGTNRTGHPKRHAIPQSLG